MDLQTQLANGHLTLRSIDPLELTPGKFADIVRMAVDDGATTIVIDSLTGFIISVSCGRCRATDSESAFFSRAAKRHDFVGFRPAWSVWIYGRANPSDELSRGRSDPVALL